MWRIDFFPLVPMPIFWGLACAVLAVVAISIWAGYRSGYWRLLALILAFTALGNPSILQEEREGLDDIVAVVIDRSESQKIGDRSNQSDRALKDIKEQLTEQDNIDLRIVDVGADNFGPNRDGTHAFSKVSEALEDVSPGRLAGIILITDGQIHDAPEDPGDTELGAPLHSLIAGERDGYDRKLTIERAPVFGIVGDSVSVTLRVDEFGASKTTRQGLISVDVLLDGRAVQSQYLPVAQSRTIDIDIDHGGENVVEIRIEAAPEELTEKNNVAVLEVNGVRDRLRVLLVSGEPHAGERTWRNLLKADPSVDLVHFTILRPPEKQDGTPIDELSLIAFPTRELFSEKLDDFDLIIFDRYQRRNVLPLIYLANVARFVEDGGALLTAAGPAFATTLSLYRTPLAGVLPAQPTGEVFEEGFRPRVTLDGARHPVTAKLSGANTSSVTSEPNWGRWFRLVATERVSGNTLMSGPDQGPVLVLDRVGEGRVAQLLSDHSWLWARGYEGGGPQAELLRRLAHWLMKEPELEEEKLFADVENGTLVVKRRTMDQILPDVVVTTPSGEKQTANLTESEDGLWTASISVSEIGLYRLENGSQVAVAAVGPLNPKEFSDVRSTDQVLAPTSKETGGATLWLNDLRRDAPLLRRVSKGRETAGRDWIGLIRNDAYTVQSVASRALFPPWLFLVMIAAAVLFAWRREGA